MDETKEMWQCKGSTCGYMYRDEKGDRKGGVEKGTKFEDLPDDWKCPSCGAGKGHFEKIS